MRRAGLILSALFATTPLAVGQTPTTPGTTPMVPVGLGAPGAIPGGPRPVAAVIPVANAAPAPAVLAHLRAWEAKNKTITSLYSECELVAKEELRAREKKSTGVILCLKPNLAKMQITNQADKNDFVMYVADGLAVHEYLGVDKTVAMYKIPQGGKGGVGDNLLMEFMSGLLTADDLIQRFDIKLDKEEDFYIHLKITPRLEKDSREFESMLLVLYSTKLADRKWEYLPAVCRMKKSSGNGDVVDTWTFKDHRVNVQNVTKAQFVAPPLPTGWTVRTTNSAAPGKAPTPNVPAMPTTPKR